MKRSHSITPTQDDPPRKLSASPGPCSATYSNPLPATQLRPPCTMDSPTRQLEAAFSTPEAATLPETPLTGRSRTRPRTARPSRHDSLMDTKVVVPDVKVLLATRLKRTDSLNQPDLFRFAEHFEFLSLLGLTPYSEVYKVRHRQTKELYAVKRCRRKIQSRAERQRCMQEIMAVAALPEHPNIVGHYRAWQQEGHFYIQMDLCEGGNLDTISAAAQQQGQCLQEEVLWLVMRDVGRGLQVLHDCDCLHLDIKPSNIYAHTHHDGSVAWRIGDFGLAVLKQQWDWEEGDGRYVAPELLSNHTSPTFAADVYSLGATLYECATGHVLPRSEEARDTGSVMLPNRSSSFQWLVQQMLHPDPAHRPTAAHILEQINQLHGWVLPFTPPSVTSVATSPTSNATTALPSPFASPRAGVGGWLGGGVQGGHSERGSGYGLEEEQAAMDVSFDLQVAGDDEEDDTATQHGQQRRTHGQRAQHMAIHSLPSFGVPQQRFTLDHDVDHVDVDHVDHHVHTVVPSPFLPHRGGGPPLPQGGSPCGSECSLQPMMVADTPQLFRQASRRGGVPLRGPSFSFAQHPLPLGGQGSVHALGGLLRGMSDMSIAEDRAPGSPTLPMTLRFDADSGRSSPLLQGYGSEGGLHDEQGDDIAPQGPLQPCLPMQGGPSAWRDPSEETGGESAEEEEDVAGVLQSARKLSFGLTMEEG